MVATAVTSQRNGVAIGNVTLRTIPARSRKRALFEATWFTFVQTTTAVTFAACGRESRTRTAIAVGFPTVPVAKAGAIRPVACPRPMIFQEAASATELPAR